MRFLLVLGCIFPLTAIAGAKCQNCEVYVDSISGNDTGIGSVGSPLKSLHAAQREARKRISEGAVDVMVRVRGIHALETPLNLGVEDAGVTWRSYEGQRAAVHGGVQIPVNSFKPWKGNILVADLSKFPNLQLGELAGGETLGECKNNKAELYLNGMRMTLARYPNVGQDGFWQFLNAVGGVSGGLGVVYPSTIADRISKWSTEKDLYLHGYWKFDWADNHVKVRDIVSLNKSILFDLTTPALYGEVKKNARFFALNALSELDAPSEYFIDRINKKLYFQPPSGGLKTSDSVMLSNLSVVIQASDTSGLHLLDLNIQYGSNQNVQWSNVTDSSIRGCNLGSTGGNALSVSGQRIQIVNNTAREMGCKGFIIMGGSTKSLARGEITVETNTIEAFSQWKRTYQPGLSWNGVGNTYRHNVIRNGPHTAAQGGGNDNLFDGNYFDTLAYEVDDTGAWYSGRSWAKRNNTLVNNVFANVVNKVKTYLGAPSVQAVYNDDQLSGNTFRNNTFIDCHCGLFIGGGRNHIVEENYFIRTATPVHVDDRGLTWQKSDCTSPNGQFWTELNTLKYKEAPYATHYPELLKIDRPCVPVHNVIRKNQFCGSTKFADISAATASSWNITLVDNTEKPSLCAKSEHVSSSIVV